jgi:hypothetical protein
MTFKEFLRLGEDASSSEKGGLMGYGVPVRTRKPSDGQPFKDKLNSVAGDKGPTGGGPGSGPVMGAPTMGSPGGMFMKKR